MRFARFAVLTTALFASSALLGACGDDSLFPDVQLSTDTVTITVPGTGQASALDLVRLQPPFSLLRRPELLTDATEWDIALRRGDAGLVLRPYEGTASALRGAGIRVAGQDYDRITEAPRATSAYASTPLPATVGSTFFFRSRQYPSQGGVLCVNYAKAKVLATDVTLGTAQIALVLNTNCEDERLADD